MGRPATGPVSTLPPALKEAILCLRKLHSGWGPDPPLTARKHGCLTICFDPDHCLAPSIRRKRRDHATACPKSHEGRVNGGACGPASLADLPISPPIFPGGFATISVHSHLDQHDFV